MYRLRSNINQTKSSLIPSLASVVSLALVARLTILVRQRSGTEFTHIDSFATLQIILVILSVGLLLSIPYQKQIWSKISNTSISMLIAYYLLSGISALWSPLPLYSLFRAIEYLSQILIIFMIIWHYDECDYAENRMLFLSSIVMLLGIGMIVRLNGFSMNLGRWHANHYTVPASMIFCYCLGEYLSHPEGRRQRLQRYGFVGLIGLILGTSVASFFAAGAGMIVAIVLSTRGRALLTSLLVTVLLISGLIMLTQQVEASLSWIDLGQQLKIFSLNTIHEPAFSAHGRATLWGQYIEDIKQSPIYGHGFAISSRLAGFYSTNTHNGFLAVLLGTGLIGFSMVFWSGCRLAREVRRSVRTGQMGSVGCAAALTAGLVNNLSISFIGEQWRTPSFVFVAILGFLLIHVLKQEAAVPISPERMGRTPMDLRRRAMSPLVPFSRPPIASRVQPQRRFTVRRGVSKH